MATTTSTIKDASGQSWTKQSDGTWRSSTGQLYQGQGSPANAVVNPEVQAAGTRTSGTTVGQPMMIQAPTMPAANTFAAPQVGPTATYGGATLAAPAMAQGVQADYSGVQPYQQGQDALIAQLQAQTMGQGPNLAGLQYQQSAEQALAQQMGLIAAQKGLSPALATRYALDQGATLNQQAAMQAEQTRQAQAINAHTQLASALGTGVSQQQAQAGTQAQLAQNTALANQSATNAANTTQAGYTQQAGLANALAQNTNQQYQANLGLQTGQSNQAAINQQASTQAQLQQQAAAGNQSAFNTANNTQGQIAGGISQSTIAGAATTGAAAITGNAAQNVANTNAAASVQNNAATNATQIALNNPGVGLNQNQTSVTSDKNAKKDIKPAGKDVDKFLEALQAKSFRYKDPSVGEGDWTGIMAQDAEKSKMGKGIVTEGMDGKQIDMKRGLSAVLAGQARLNERLAKVEGKNGRR